MPRIRAINSMEDPKGLQLFQEVLAKTKAGRIRWEPTANELQYFSVLPGGVTLSVVETHEKDNWGSDVQDLVLVLRSDERELLRVTSDIDDVGWKGLSELYELARRQALRVDAAVDKVLGELAKL